MPRKYMTYSFPLSRKRRSRHTGAKCHASATNRIVEDNTYTYRKLRRRRRRRPTIRDTLPSVTVK